MVHNPHHEWSMSTMIGLLVYLFFPYEVQLYRGCDGYEIGTPLHELP